MHDVDQQEDELFQLEDYDSVNVRTVHFTTDVHTNIAFDEISGGGRLQHLLTDVQLSDKSGASSTVRIKLDTVLVAIYCHLTFTRKSILRYLLKSCVEQLIKGFA